MRNRLTGVAALGAAATLALGGCSSFSSTKAADNEYCIDETDQVVADYYCDDDLGLGAGDGRTFYYVRGPYAGNLSPGSRLDVTKAKKRTLITALAPRTGGSGLTPGSRPGSNSGSNSANSSDDSGATRKNTGGFGSSSTSSSGSSSYGG